MDYPISLVKSLQQQLTAELEHLGAIRSRRVSEAFRAIPRHRFLPHYYERQDSTLHWQKRQAPAADSNPTSIRTWLETVYTNRARTTLLDENQLPHDRIIATARVATVPDAWYEQLAPDGKLVMDLGGQLSGSLLVAQKRADGSLQGSFHPLNMHFISLQSPSLPSSPSFRDLVHREPEQVYTVEAKDFLPLVFGERDFRFFLQWCFPTAALEWWGKDHATLLPAFFDQEQETLLTFANDSSTSHWTVQVRGRAPLWQQVFQAFQDWQQLGRPASTDYRLHIQGHNASQKRLTVYLNRDQRSGPCSTFLLA